MKFRKKQVVVEAIRFDGTESSVIKILHMARGNERAKALQVSGYQLMIPTLEGTMAADDGDWIIKGIKGEIYPCKPDIFEATYEKVEE